MNKLIRRSMLVAFAMAIISVIIIPCAMAQSLGVNPSMHYVLQAQDLNKLGPQPEPPDSSLKASVPVVHHAVGYNRRVVSAIASAPLRVIRLPNRNHAMGTPMPIPPSVRIRFGKR